MNPQESRLDSRILLASAAAALTAGVILRKRRSHPLADHPHIDSLVIPERRLVLFVDAAAGQARRNLKAALSAAGVGCIDAGAALETLGRRNTTSSELRDNDGALLRGLTAACAAADEASTNKGEGSIAVFLSAVAFRGLGRAIVKQLPLVRLVFAYGTAFEVAGGCACVSGNSGWQTFGPNEPAPHHLTLAHDNRSPFLARGLAPLLSALPRKHAVRLDAWMGAVDLLFDIKDSEDEASETAAATSSQDMEDGANENAGTNTAQAEGADASAAAAAQVKARAERVLSEWFKSGNDASSALGAEAVSAARGGHGFAPFVLRLAFVSDPSTREASLSQLLQFVFVGSPAAAVALSPNSSSSTLTVPPDALSHAIAAVAAAEAASAAARNGWWHQIFCRASVSERERSALAALCFAHKRLLLADKVLLDTVLPESGARWKLRSKPKGGCGCCAPGDDDSEAAATVVPPKDVAMAMPGAFGQPRARRRTAAKV